MSTAYAAAPLTHEAFRQRQKAAQLDGLTYKSVRVAWTDLGKGEPVILLHGIPTWSFLYNEVIPQLAQHNALSRPISLATAILTGGTFSTAPCWRRPTWSSY